MNNTKSKLDEHDLKIEGIVHKEKKAITNWSIRNDQLAKKDNNAPQAYQFMAFYQRKKEQAIQKRNEEMRKMREFTSRPVPQFYAHPINAVKRKVHYITVPKTPQVLKRSLCYKEKEKCQAIQLKLDSEGAAFKSRPPTVLKGKPFVPKKTLHEAPKICPFKLRSDSRVQERKKYDAQLRQALEMRLQYEEDKRRQEEEKRIKEIKKIAKFKAQPNPIKK